MHRALTCVVLGLAISAAAACQAAVVTYFGEDLNTGETTRLASTPNSNAARASFLATLSGVGTQNFESFASGTSGNPLALSFPGSAGAITATLTAPGASVLSLPGTGTSAGRYPISGDNFLQGVMSGSGPSAFTIDFSAPISAFGFYGTDFGDFSGVAELQLINGGTTTVSVGNSSSNLGGSALYFGVLSTTAFDKVVFRNTSLSNADVFGFDDMTIGDRQQVVGGLVPEPASLIVWSVLGIAGAVAYRRRRAT